MASGRGELDPVVHKLKEAPADAVGIGEDDGDGRADLKLELDASFGRLLLGALEDVLRQISDGDGLKLQRQPLARGSGVLDQVINESFEPLASAPHDGHRVAYRRAQLPKLALGGPFS